MLGIPEGGKERSSFCIHIEQSLELGKYKEPHQGNQFVMEGREKKTIDNEN